MNPARALGPAVVSDYFNKFEDSVKNQAVSIKRITLMPCLPLNH